MRHRLLTAPWWMLSLGAGVLLGLAIGLSLMFVVPLLYGVAHHQLAPVGFAHADVAGDGSRPRRNRLVCRREAARKAVRNA